MTAIKKQLPAESFANAIRQQILDGSLQPGNYLLPERELARKHNLSLRVVREGLAKLAAEKWIRRHQGKGTIVLRRAESQPCGPKNVAWVIPGRIRDTSGAELCDALQQGFQAHGYGTILYSSDGIAQKETEIIQQLVRDRIPGAALFSAHPCTSFEHLAEARAAGMKLVLVDHDFPAFDCDWVSIDDQLGAYEATEHLVRLGCAALMHVTTGCDWTSCRLRRRGFETAVSRFGRTRSASVVVLEQYMKPTELIEAVRREFPKALAAAARPLGVVAVNDAVALALMDYLREQGISVPQEVAVVGFNNDIEGALAEIPLTTVEIPREEIAGHAVQCLMEQLRGEKRETRRIRLKPRLVLRQSCGTYPAWENTAKSVRET